MHVPRNASMNLRRKTSGAALVVGLILLLVITVLAVSAMATGTLELMMSGNEQYRQNALRAADVGVEQAIANINDVPTTGAEISDSDTVIGLAKGEYATKTVWVASGPVPLNSSNKLVGHHFTITSTGRTTVRNASVVQEQGVALIAPSAGGSGSGPAPEAPPLETPPS